MSDSATRTYRRGVPSFVTYLAVSISGVWWGWMAGWLAWHGAFVGGLVLLIFGSLFVLLFLRLGRMRLVLADSGVVVVNLLRTHKLTWGQVVEFLPPPPCARSVLGILHDSGVIPLAKATALRVRTEDGRTILVLGCSVGRAFGDSTEYPPSTVKLVADLNGVLQAHRQRDDM